MEYTVIIMITIALIIVLTFIATIILYRHLDKGDFEIEIYILKLVRIHIKTKRKNSSS